MTSMKIALAAAVALFAVGTTVAFAQTTPATPPATTAPKPMTPAPAATTPAPKKTAAPRSEKSLACSREATAKGLKGKPRKAFRKQCMKKAA